MPSQTRTFPVSFFFHLFAAYDTIDNCKLVNRFFKRFQALPTLFLTGCRLVFLFARSLAYIKCLGRPEVLNSCTKIYVCSFATTIFGTFFHDFDTIVTKKVMTLKFLIGFSFIDFSNDRRIGAACKSRP